MAKTAIQRWQRKAQTGSHSFHWQGRKYRVKPGDTVEVPEHILGSFVDKYVLLPSEEDRANRRRRRQEQEQPARPEPAAPPKGPELVDIGGGMYDIVNPDNPDKPLNDEPLTLDQAQAFLDNQEEDPK
jgi:hypothetical protein